MEDWENFFADKSRRRFDKGRRRSIVRIATRLAWGALFLLGAVSLIVAIS